MESVSFGSIKGSYIASQKSMRKIHKKFRSIVSWFVTPVHQIPRINIFFFITYFGGSCSLADLD